MASKAAQPEAPEQLGELEREEAPAVAADYRIGQEKIAEIVKFHATPVVTQALRETFGWLGREAAAASRKRPRNRPADFAGWPLPALKLLAELCQAYAPETGTVVAPREPEMFPDAADAAIAAHEDAIPAVVAERLPVGTRTEALATVLDAPAEGGEWAQFVDGLPPASGQIEVMPASDPFYAPDPWIAPADWAQPNGASVEAPLFYAPDPWTDGEVGAGK